MTYVSKTDQALKELIGKIIKRVEISEDYLVFTTEDFEGTLTKHSFYVYGECCSHSYFSEVYGVAKLVGPVVSIEEDDDNAVLQDPPEITESYANDVKVYGYKIVSDHPMFGEVTTVIGFRNVSNGYYGGAMEPCGYPNEPLTTVVDNWSADQ